MHENLPYRPRNKTDTLQNAEKTEIKKVSSRTLDELWLVGTPHVLQQVVIEGLGQLGRHGAVEVGLVALQDGLQGELTDAEHLKLPVHDTLGPRSAVVVVEQTQVEDFTNSLKNKNK